MNTKQVLLQFVQQIMHEGIDALIDRIANRVIEKLDEARMSMPQTAAENAEVLPQPKDVVKPQPNNVTDRNLSSHNLLSRNQPSHNLSSHNLSSHNQEKHTMSNPTLPPLPNKPCY